MGEIFRTRQQIRDLARRLLNKQNYNTDKIEELTKFLCSDSGSHDYTINRREANDLGLNIEKCTKELYEVLSELHFSYASQMELQKPFDRNELIALANNGGINSYSYLRAIIESCEFGAHHFVTEGEVVVEQPSSESGDIQQTAINIRDIRTFEGWRKVS